MHPREQTPKKLSQSINPFSFEDNNQQGQDFLSDIASIVQRLNKNNVVNIQPSKISYSEYDPESIFPPPSQYSQPQQIASINNEQQNIIFQASKSNNNLSNIFKRKSTNCRQVLQNQINIYATSKKIKRISIERTEENPAKNEIKPIVVNHIKLIQSKNAEILTKISPSKYFSPDPQFQPNKLKMTSKITNMVRLSTVQNYKITDFFNSYKNSKNCQTLFKKQNKGFEDLIKYQLEEPNKIHEKLFNFNEEKSIQDSISSSSEKSQSYFEKLPEKQALIQKNTIKMVQNQKLHKQLQILKQQTEQLRVRTNDNKQSQKQELRQQMVQTSIRQLAHRKYQADIVKYLKKSVHIRLAARIQSELAALKQYRQKHARRRRQTHTDQQSLRQAQKSSPEGFAVKPSEKRNYLQQWVNKMDKARQRASSDEKYFQTLQKWEEAQIPREIKEKVVELKNYQFLSVLLKGQQLVDFEFMNLKAFNFETLNHEVVTLMKYRRFTKSEDKLKVEAELNTLLKASIKLYNSTTHYFLQTTNAMPIFANSEYIMLSRQFGQQVQSLDELVNKLDGFNELMIKYIVRGCIGALEAIKVKIGIPAFFFSTNVYFTSKKEIKFGNILFNKILLKEQFRDKLIENNFYYFVAPEYFNSKLDNLNAVWSLGILIYFCLYEKYPFEYQFKQKEYNSRQNFFNNHQLNFPTKPTLSQKLKQFITFCLTSKEKDIGNLLKHPYFQK